MPRHQGRDLVARIASENGWEAFERPMPELFYTAAERNPDLIIDIGCNTGFYALLACAASSLNSVLAFEPDPNVRELLLSNIVLNKLGARIVVSPLALSNETAERDLYIPDQGHGLIESS